MQEKELLQLIRKARSKDPDAFSSLIYFYMKDLYRVAISILMNDEDAADAIQDTILGCWEKLYTLKQEKYFKTWLTRILINHCYDMRKKQQRMIKDARRFAETFGAQLRIFPQGEHPLMGNGELEAVLAWAADFFLGKE